MSDFASSRALIVGINAYGNDVPALRSAVNDAQGLAKILDADHGYSVTLLTDREATLSGLKHHFEEVLPQQVGDQDRVLVYFAGHGIAEEGDDGPTGYLLPQDARPDDRESFLRMETFRGWLGKLRCRHLLVILDCCFAGAFRWTKETRHIRPILEVIHRERYERFIRHPAWQAIASAAYDQEALDAIAGKVLGRRRPAADNTPNSPFASALFEGLKGAADLTGDGVIMAYELATFLRDHVSLSADDARHEQMPSIWSLGKEQSGEFIFLVPGHPLNLPPAPELKAENNPYRGLSPYEESDASLFFGRDQVVEDLAAVVKKQPLTMVLGASGTGKSSLVRAGLLSYPRKLAAASVAADAELASDAVLFGKDAATEGIFHRLLMRPADAPNTPLRGLIMRLSKAGAEAPSGSPSESATDETPAVAVAAFSAWFAADPKRHLFLVIDQFEELVTLCNNEVRTTFLDFLADLLELERDRLRIVLTLRSDFEPQFADSALQRHLQAGEEASETRFLVPPLQHNEFREIIEKPASERVLFFEPPALVDRLITEVIQMPGALPLLSFALSELYLKYVERQTAAQQRGEIIDRAITEEDYQQLGGVVGALSKRATEEYDACDEPHRRTMQRVMLRMVATEGELARRRVPRDELIYPSTEETERASAVLERLEKARLVVSGRRDGSDHGNAGSEYVEPAHDALVRSWGKLLDWQREAAAELPVHRRLAEAAGEWARRARDSGLLWTSDPRLPLVRQQLTAPDSWLNKRETEFVEASTRRRRRNTRIRWSIAGVVVAGALAFSVGIWQQRNEARRERDTAIARQLIAESARVQEEWPQLSLLLAVESQNTAARLNGLTLPEVETNLLGLLQSIGGSPLAGHLTQIRTSQFSPDGRWVISSSSDSVRLWDVRGAEGTVRPIAPLLGQNEGVMDISPDGSLLVTVEGEKPQVWNLHADSPADTKVDLPGDANYLVFSPEGRWLAGLRRSGGRVQLWQTAQVSRGAPATAVLEEPAGVVTQVLFTPDGARLITGTNSGATAVWDLRDGEKPRRQTLPMSLSGAITDLKVSPDGRWLAALDETRAVNLLNLSSMSVTVLPSQELAAQRQFAFSQDSRWFATINHRGKGVFVCDLLAGQDQACRILTHPSNVGVMTFSPDSMRLVTGAGDATARVWNLTGADAFREPLVLRGHSGEIRAVAVAADGRWMATGSRDDTIRLWDLHAEDPAATSRVLRGLESVTAGINFGVEYVAFSPDGRWLLGRAYESKLRVWDLSTGLLGRLPLLANGCENSGSSVCRGRPWKVENIRGSRASLGAMEQTASQSDSRLEIKPTKDEASAGPDGRYRVMRLGDEAVRVCEGDASQRCVTVGRDVELIQFSPDGHWLLAYKSTPSPHWADLYELRNFPNDKPFRLDINPWTKARFDRSGQWLVATSENALWHLDSRQPRRRELAGHTKPINNLAFSPDHRWLATSSGDAILLWALTPEASDPVRLNIQGLGSADAPSVDFSADSRWLAMRTTLGPYVWPLDIEKIVESAGQTAGRKLSRQEWRKYIGVEATYPTISGSAQSVGGADNTTAVP